MPSHFPCLFESRCIFEACNAFSAFFLLLPGTRLSFGAPISISRLVDFWTKTYCVDSTSLQCIANKAFPAAGCSSKKQDMQAFNWESHRQNWWETVSQQAQRFADMGFTLVWLPPPTASVAAQGYMPLDLYNLNSAYGSEDSLRRFDLILSSLYLPSKEMSCA